MSPESLELLVIEDQPFNVFRKAFSSLSDQERRKLSKTAQTLHKHVTQSQNNWEFKELSGTSGRLNKLLKEAHNATFKKTKHGMTMSRPNWVSSLENRAVLSLFAVAPMSALKSNNIWFRTNNDELYHVLLDRKPDWLGDWVEHQLNQEWPRLSFPFVSKLIESNLIKKPSSDAYIALYANWLMRTNDGWRDKNPVPAPPISEQLKASPVLMEDVYRVFHVESNAFNTNSWLKKGASDNYESWTDALLKMTEDGTLDRKRVLSESLSALTADLKSNQLSGIAKFHKKLNATPAELKANEDRYRALLASPMAPVARFGLDQLAALHKAKKLDIETFLGEIPIIFTLPVKSHPMAAVKLLARMTKSEKAQFAGIMRAIVPALAHENVDVQTEALETLEMYADHCSSDLKEEIYAQSHFISPHLKSRLLSLAGQRAEEISVAANDLDDSVERLSALSAYNKQAWGFDKLLEDPFNYYPITENILQLRVLHTVKPIEEIKSQDELLSAIAAFIESPTDISEGERIAHAIATIKRVADDDFKARVKPLIHRLKMDLKTDNYWELAAAPLAGGALADLIKTYLRPSYKRNKFDFQKDWQQNTAAQLETRREDAPMSAHLRILAHFIANGKTPGRCCTPTHENGWICPNIWIDRLSVPKEGNRIDQIDLSYSMLRLAPDNRSEAAKNIDRVSGRLKDLAAFVLGVDDNPEIKSNIEVWMSAARARDPVKDWTELFAHLNITSIPPGAVSPRSLKWHVEDTKHHSASLKTEVTPPVDGKKTLFKKNITILDKKLPATMLGEQTRRNRYQVEDRSAEQRRWYATLFPLYPAMSFRSAIRGMVSRIDDTSNSFEPVHGALDALFQKNRPWGEMGHLVLALGILGRDADALALSNDALIEGIESGQLDPNRLASVLERLCEAQWIKLNRPGTVLLQVAQISPLHAFVVTNILSKWLPSLDPKRRSLGDLLEVLLQSSALANTGLSPELRAYLGKFSGSSKAAKAAKSLLKLPEDAGEGYQPIKESAISMRLRYV